MLLRCAEPGEQPCSGGWMPFASTRGADALPVEFIGDGTDAGDAGSPDGLNDPLKVHGALCCFFPDPSHGFSVAGLLAPEGTSAVRVDTSSLSRTPNDILREILDVQSNLPVWVENKIAHIIDSTPAGNTTERARLIMEELERLGFTEALLEY
jgi:hypothetical protein